MHTFSFDEEFFYDDNEDDELDLFKLVSTDSNDMNQYLLFKGSSSEWYAMNVSKIEEVIIFDKGIQISRNNDSENMIIGTADIRDSMIPLIYFDAWYGNKVLSDEEYNLVILANYGGHRFGIIVQEVSSISIIEADSMTDNSKNSLKSTFIAKIMIESKSEMCTIYDGDKMLLDIFDSIEQHSNYNFSEEARTSLKEKIIFFADDSRFVRSLVEALFKHLGCNYKIFNDGLNVSNYLDSHPKEKVDLFITDLEMPNMGGRELIINIQEREEYKNVALLVHTNMSNSAMQTELIEAGVTDIIAKINMKELGNSIISLLSKAS